MPRLGAKAFELSAGFLRVNHGDQPLDRSGVHPEAYSVVRRILDRLGADIHAVIGNARALQGLKGAVFADDRFGDKLARNFLGAIRLVAAVIQLN